MASDYELNRVCAEEYLNYYDKHREEIDFDSLVIERISLVSVDVQAKVVVEELRTLGALIGSAPESQNYTINSRLIGRAKYRIGVATEFTVETKWDFTNNKQLFADDFAELMFRDLEDYLYKHYSTAREMEE